MIISPRGNLSQWLDLTSERYTVMNVLPSKHASAPCGRASVEWKLLSGFGVRNCNPECGRIAMDSITWPVVALALASITLLLSSVGNEIRRRRKLNQYRTKVVAELRQGLA